MYICYEHSMYVSHISVSWGWYMLSMIGVMISFMGMMARIV